MAQAMGTNKECLERLETHIGHMDDTFARLAKWMEALKGTINWKE